MTSRIHTCIAYPGTFRESDTLCTLRPAESRRSNEPLSTSSPTSTSTAPAAMSPTNPFIAAQLRQLIYYHLDNELLQNALFCAGRLHGLEPRNPDAAHLFALCHLRLGRLKAAYEYSRDKGLRGHHLGCAYVFAQACLGLERYVDGIGALDRARGLWGGRSHWSEWNI